MRSSLFCQAHAPRAPAVWAGPEQKRTERSYSAGDVQRGLAAILTALHFNQTDLSAEKASLDCGHPSMARKVSAVPHVCCARAPVTPLCRHLPAFTTLLARAPAPRLQPLALAPSPHPRQLSELKKPVLCALAVVHSSLSGVDRGWCSEAVCKCVFFD